MSQILFGGESIEDIPQETKDKFICLPPIRRGDLDKLNIEKTKTKFVLILDGVYGSSMSITPTECRQFIEGGGNLVGASSMGALRACELWSVGMVGIGQVYNMFRLGHLKSDADVAVAYDTKTFKEITVSIVHLRSILSILERESYISHTLSRQLLQNARGIVWFERYWEILVEEWKKKFQCAENVLVYANYLYKNPLFHPKKRDALEALSLIGAKRWP